MNTRSLRRAALLALGLLASCAASDPSRQSRSGAFAADSASGAGRTGNPASPGGGITGSAAPLAPLPAGDFLVGRAAGVQGDLQLAAKAFLDALARNPDVLTLQEQAFLACLLTGRPETERLALQLRGNPIAELFLGDRAAQRGRWDEAQSRFAGLPDQGLTQALQPLLLAWTRLGAGHPDQALDTMQPYLEGQHVRAIYFLHAAYIADISQRDPEAARLYHQAETTPNAMDLGLARALASWRARQGDTQGARRTLEAFIEQSPDLAMALPALERAVAQRPVGKATDGMADVYFAVAGALRDQDATDYAALMLRLALDLRPDLTAARLLSADIMSESKHPASALRVLEPVAADDPLAGVVDLRRAALLDANGQSGQALALLGRMELQYPNRPEPWTLQGSILSSEHRYADAVSAYDAAVQRVPTPSRANWPLFYARGIALDRAGRWPQAEQDLRHALLLSPDEPYVLNYLAYSWTEQGRNLAEAREMLDRAARARPNDGAILDSLGWVRLHQGDVAGAVRELERAVELEPEDPTINGHLGDAYAAAGRHREALYQWRLALTFNPDPDDLARLKAKLREAGASDIPGPAADAKGTAADAKATP